MQFLRKLLKIEPPPERCDVPRRFELIGRVGRGSMSQVWRARDGKTGQVVALKVLDKNETRNLEARFKGLKRPSEGEVAVQLMHPAIPRTFEHGETTEGEPYLVMEFVEGVSLTYPIETQPEPFRKARVAMMVELGEAIAHCHEKGFIHRDVCPRNVIVTPDWHAKLIDFGLVVPNTPEFQKPGNRTGTARYMAPELLRRQKTDHRIDVFSFAMTCFEMLTGRLPWEAHDARDVATQYINVAPTPLANFAPELPADLGNAVMHGISPAPEDRWKSMPPMVEALRAFT